MVLLPTWVWDVDNVATLVASSWPRKTHSSREVLFQKSCLEPEDCMLPSSGGGVLQMPACTGWSMFSTDGVFEEFSWQTLKCLYWTSVNWEISKVYSLAKCGWIFKEMAKGTSPRAGPSLLQMLCFCSKAQSPQLNIVRNNIPIFFFNFIFRNGWIIFAKSFQNNRGLGKRSAEQISIWKVMFSKGKYCLTRAVPVLSIINYKAKF